jgi:peptide deformylase
MAEERKNKIITNRSILEKPVAFKNPIPSLETIKSNLLDILRKSETGIGLAANQIDISHRVCLIWSDRFVDGEPIFLVNPKILELDDEQILFEEECLSFPGKTVVTRRSKWVTVETDNLGIVMFGPSKPDDENGNVIDGHGLVQAIVVQHEIDHLDGITMFDRREEPLRESDKKEYGRNEKVTIQKDGEQRVLKYKKAEKFVEQGWIIMKG